MSAINYYRAAMRWPGDLNGVPQSVHVPTLLIWGEKDRYLGLDLTEGLETWVTCSVDEENLGGQLFLKYGGFKALPVTDEARCEKMIQFARSAKG